MTPGQSPRELYAARLSARTTEISTLDRLSARISLLRLAVFAIAGALVWLSFRGQASAWWIAAPFAAFIWVVWWQSRVDSRIKRARRSVRFYEDGIARLEHRWQGHSEDGGSRFLDPHHPYAADLDLFGHASLFELISTARTRGGESRLAAWLTTPATPDDIRSRHEAVDELRPLLDLRERLATLGEDFRAGVHPEALAEWASAPVQPFSAISRVCALVLAGAAFAALMWCLATDLANADARLAFLTVGLAEAIFSVPLRKRILRAAGAVEEPAHDLDLLSRILEAIEAEEFRSPSLCRLREALRPAASDRIAGLRRLTDMLESRENPIVRAIGPVVLWTTQLGMAIEAWRAESGARVPGWLDAVSELEALSALANYAFEHPDDPFPCVGDAPGPLFEGEELGHPLLAADRCVRNTVRLAAPLRLLIVSGSNMSGKSTLLRAVGVNAVLALAGAPVRAKRMTLSCLSLGASIRATDSLEEGQSRFMSEILRLKQVLELKPPVLFLLDELLGGTNSHDRSIGSEGLIRALLERGGLGLVTTHDLTLARVADALAPVAANVHFEDRLENGRLVFDYRMRPGVVTRSNALDLMRAVGLDV